MFETMSVGRREDIANPLTPGTAPRLLPGRHSAGRFSEEDACYLRSWPNLGLLIGVVATPSYHSPMSVHSCSAAGSPVIANATARQASITAGQHPARSQPPTPHTAADPGQRRGPWADWVTRGGDSPIATQSLVIHQDDVSTEPEAPSHCGSVQQRRTRTPRCGIITDTRTIVTDTRNSDKSASRCAECVPHSSSPVREPDFTAMRLRLAQLRQQRGWSYNELAARAGIGRNTLVTLENGKPRRNPDLPETHGTLLTWYRIAEAFEMTLGELLEPLQPHRHHREHPSRE